MSKLIFSCITEPVWSGHRDFRFPKQNWSLVWRLTLHRLISVGMNRSGIGFRCHFWRQKAAKLDTCNYFPNFGERAFICCESPPADKGTAASDPGGEVLDPCMVTTVDPPRGLVPLHPHPLPLTALHRAMVPSRVEHTSNWRVTSRSCVSDCRCKAWKLFEARHGIWKRCEAWHRIC